MICDIVDGDISAEVVQTESNAMVREGGSCQAAQERRGECPPDNATAQGYGGAG